MRVFIFISLCLALCCSCINLPEKDNTPDENVTEKLNTAETPQEIEETEIAFEPKEVAAADESTVELASLIPKPRFEILGPAFLSEPDKDEPSEVSGELASALCREIGAKLGSVDEEDCLRQNLLTTGSKSVQGRDLALKNYLPMDSREPLGRVLIIGGIHGDEFSSVSVVFKWMDILNQHHSGLFHWRFLPASNPDGLLNKKSQRQNANGVDLNRNFPTKDWGATAISHWVERAYRQPRRYPGEMANSEPETQWLVNQIEEFQPDVIVAMHAPYHLVDYDGPPKAPGQLGSLYLRKLGVFPGSLGNYAGVDLNIPIVTVELASAGSMPSRQEISDMWDDLISWLRGKLSETDS